MSSISRAIQVSRPARPRCLAALCAALSLAVGPAALGQNLKGYWTKNQSIKDTKPPGAPGARWDEVAPGGEIRITLAPGERIWFGFCNEESFGWHKFFRFQIRPYPGSQLSTEDMVGFDDDGEPIEARMHGCGFGPEGREETWRFDDQPEWERIEFSPTLGGLANERVFVRARSACTFRWRTAPTDLIFPLTDTSFGAPGAMDGEPRVRKLWIFPWRWFVDGDVEPSFEAPLHTGEWHYEHVFVDPEGTERPFGGVLWTTDGPGLATGDRFSQGLPMLGHLDRRYDVFTLDDETGTVNRFEFGAPRWHDALDTYEPGPLAGRGGWAPWNGDPDAGHFDVGDERSHSAPNALEIDGPDDAVHEFSGYTYGVHELTTWVFVPEAMDDLQHFILLNTYPAADPEHWSLQLELDGALGVVADRNGNARLPLRRGVWTPLRVLIDLDRDTQTVWYDGERLLDKPWTAGVAEGGAGRIAAVNLYGTDSAHRVHYDDLLLDDGAPVGACEIEDGSCLGRVHAEFCVFVGGVYLGHETACTSACPADLTGDGNVAFDDLLIVLGAWGECAACPADLDGDGFVGFGDLLAVLATWGPCAEQV